MDEFTPERYGFTPEEWAKLPADTKQRLTGMPRGSNSTDPTPVESERVKLSQPKGVKGLIWKATKGRTAKKIGRIT